MSEQTQSETMPESNDAPHCPWCSAPLASGDEEVCPSCQATLRDMAGKELPGVTSVDHEALLRSRKPVAKSSGLMGWLSGSYQEEAEAPPAPHTFSPPDTEVKREMLRMELAAIEARVEAQRAELEAELTAAGARVVEPAEPPEAAIETEPETEKDLSGADSTSADSTGPGSAPPA